MMKIMKKGISVILVISVLFALLLTGCGGNKLKESALTGEQVQEEFWNMDLDASAEYLNGYRAQSLEEVTINWRQAKMYGNGAILYSVYSVDMKGLFLNLMKLNFGSWNFYYGIEDTKPLDVVCSEPLPIEDIDNMYYSKVTTKESDGVTVTSYDIYIELIDGGYFVTSETSPEIVQS